MSIRTALDSDDLSVFGYGQDFILTYSDLVTNPAAFEAEYPSKQVVYIDRGAGDPGEKASIADVETGALTAGQLAEWFDRKAAAHVGFLTYYCDRSTLPMVEAALGGRHMYRWIATWGGVLAVAGFTPMVGPDLIQISNAEQAGIHADFSLVLNPTWHPTPQPTALGACLTDVGNAVRDLGTISGILNGVTTKLKTMV